MNIKPVWQVEIGDTINGQPVVGRGQQENPGEYILLFMDKDGYIQQFTFESGISFMVDDCVAVPEILPSCEPVWHRVSDDLPTKDGRYLVYVAYEHVPIIAYARLHSFSRPVIWSQFVDAIHYPVEGNVYWWAEIPTLSADLYESRYSAPTVKHQPSYGMKL